MATLQEILAHPDFKGLPDTEKQKALSELIPGFGDLPQAEQMKGMAEIMGRVSQPPIAQPAPQSPQTGPAETSNIPSIKELASMAYENSPIPGFVDTAKLVSMPFRPSSYQGMGEALEKPVMSSEGIGGQLGRGMLNTLPMAGALAGGAVGTLAGAGIMSPVLGAAGTGLGYGIGARAQKLLQTYLGLYEPKSLTEEWKQTAQEVGTGIKAFMQGESGTKMLTMAGAPLAGQFAKSGTKGDTARLGQQMVEEGKMPISPDLYAPSKPAKFMQWTTDNIIPGGSIIANYRRKAVNDTISQMRQDFVEAAGLPNPFTPLKEAKAVKNKAYENFIAEGSGAPIQFSNTAKFIEENFNSPALQTSGTLKEKVNNFYEKLNATTEENVLLGDQSKYRTKRQMETTTGEPKDIFSDLMVDMENLKSQGWQPQGVGYASVNDLNDLLPYIWSKTKSAAKMGKEKNQYQKLTEESIQLRNGLKDAIDADLGIHEVDTGAKVLEALNVARDAQKNMASLGKAKYLEKLLQDSTTWNPATQHWDFQAGKFYSEVIKKQETLRNMFPDEFGIIMRFAEKSKLASGDIARMSSKPAWKQAIEIALGGGTLAAIVANPILAVPLGFSAFSAYSLMNPSGMLRKHLTTGIKPPTLTKETIKLGVMNQEE